ncbi:MAG: FHS family L-fucose permease-like MFS transporter, partial [Cellvibrionaceae bacterium]
MASSMQSTQQTTVTGGSGSYRFALVSLTSLFFMWGFITCLNDILIPHLKAVFSLNYTEAMLIQFCFFGAYFLVSLPAGKLVKKLGYQKGIVTGLVIACIGCLLFYPAAAFATYGLFLGALFVLASGITILQVAANPYVNALGSVETASSRLNLTQAFNALGTTVAPFF